MATVSTWTWPQESNAPGWIGDGSYIDLHPTRYNWRSDVEQVARYLVDTYGVWCNTYVDHPLDGAWILYPWTFGTRLDVDTP